MFFPLSLPLCFFLAEKQEFLAVRHYSLEVKNPYCCIVHNLPKLAFFCEMRIKHGKVW